MELSAGITKLEIRRAVIASELVGIDQALELLRGLEATPDAPRRRASPSRRSVRPTRAPKGDVEQAFLAALAGGPMGAGDLRSKVRSKVKIADQQFRYQCAKLVRLGRMKGTGATSGRRYSLP